MNILSSSYSKYYQKSIKIPLSGPKSQSSSSDNFNIRNYCTEVELLLRHRDNKQEFPDISDDLRYFYRINEKEFIDSALKNIEKI